MRMIHLKFIVLLKDHLGQMFIISKEVSLSGNKGEVIVLYLKNIKLNMSSNRKDRIALSIYLLIIVSMLGFGLGNHEEILSGNRSSGFIKSYVFISLWCVGYIFWSIVFFIHKTINPDHFKSFIGSGETLIKVIALSIMIPIGFSAFLYEYIGGASLFW
jgi:hypothetical protein